MKRASILLIAAIQLAVPPALTVADAYYASGSPQAAVRSHIESHASQKCARVHDEDTCAVCRFLARASAIKSGAPICPKIVDRIAPSLPGMLPEAAHASVSSPPSLPRAPPAA